MKAGLKDEWRPIGLTEINHVDRLAVLMWKQGRTYRAEAGLYAIYRQCPDGVGGVATALAKDGTETEAFSRLQLKDSAIERSIGLTIRRLQQLQRRTAAHGRVWPPCRRPSLRPPRRPDAAD